MAFPIIAGFQGIPSLEQIDQWADDPEYTVLQTYEPVPPEVWPLLNERFFRRRPDVRLRVYGFYGETCDLSFVPQMTNVTDFAADCLTDVSGVEALSQMTWLKRFSFGVYHAENFDFLEHLPADLESLALTPTKSKRPKIHALRRFTHLRRLILSGQQNGIESLAHLANLEELKLSGVAVPSLDFLVPLSNLASLDLTLGGTRDLSALREIPSLRELQIVQVPKFDELAPVAQMPGLEKLVLESLPLIKRLPDFSNSPLRKLRIHSLKGLESVAEAATAPNLEEFFLSGGPSLAEAAYEPLLEHPKLKSFWVHTGSQKLHRSLMAKAASRGLNVDRD